MSILGLPVEIVDDLESGVFDPGPEELWADVLDASTTEITF